ncbi:protoporphyrinogen oxidase [Aeromicrobium sp. CF3.5]|uniref:protoporphyrinogen oxidase n=1 Tax=Aeromicrobium sp. CF3.5 TaxID=3373078 RepID=UPI003EE513FE
MTPAPRTVAVIGGGIAGLTAAYDLAAAGCEVTVLETSDRVGGKLRQAEVGGIAVDVGAESILARRAEGLDLVRDIGLIDAIEHPSTASASIWTRDALRPMPPTVMGVPADLQALLASGIVTEAPESAPAAVPDEDVSVASFVEQRLGREVVDRLIEPLLGGVYAGHSDRLSLRATAPQVLALGGDLVSGAARSLAERAQAQQSSQPSPVFFAPTGGVGTLPDAIVAAGDFAVRTSTTVRGLDRLPAHEPGSPRWRLTIGPTTAIEHLEVDAVVVATPAPAAARLLSDVAPRAAFALAAVEYASVALVTFCLGGEFRTTGSGFLAPPVDGTVIKGASFSSSKWQWSRDAASDRAIVRTSIGRAGETLLLQNDDENLVRLALADLTAAVGQAGPVIDAHVHRWGGGLPQYEVGHLDVVDEIDADIASVEGLEVCGAAYRGVGIPAVIGTARVAAARLLGRETLGS